VIRDPRYDSKDAVTKSRIVSELNPLNSLVSLSIASFTRLRAGSWDTMRSPPRSEPLSAIRPDVVPDGKRAPRLGVHFKRYPRKT